MCNRNHKHKTRWNAKQTLQRNESETNRERKKDEKKIFRETHSKQETKRWWMSLFSLFSFIRSLTIRIEMHRNEWRNKKKKTSSTNQREWAWKKNNNKKWRGKIFCNLVSITYLYYLCELSFYRWIFLLHFLHFLFSEACVFAWYVLRAFQCEFEIEMCVSV